MRATTLAAPHVTERAWQAQVVQLARLCQWRCYHTHDSRRSAAGFPDLTLVRGHALIFAELKSERGKLTVDQRAWLDALTCVPGVRCYCWRPSDWELVVEVLR